MPERRTVVLKPVERRENNTILIEITPQEFAALAGLLYSSIPYCEVGGTLMIESKKDNLFFKFVAQNGGRSIERRSLIGE